MIQAAKMVGASRIIAVDINESKFPAAIALGATDCVNSKALDKPVQQYIAGTLTPWGGTYLFSLIFFSLSISKSRCSLSRL